MAQLPLRILGYFELLCCNILHAVNRTMDIGSDADKKATANKTMPYSLGGTLNKYERTRGNTGRRCAS